MKAEINLDEVIQTIDSLHEELFSMHDFVNAFSRMFNDSYNNLLQSYTNEANRLHPVLGKYLQNHATELNIVQEGLEKDNSYNVHGNIGPSQIWRKIKK